jgi:hypothetical protein
VLASISSMSKANNELFDRRATFGAAGGLLDVLSISDSWSLTAPSAP